MSKKYTPNEKEKYMCEKHRVFFKKKLLEWRNEIIESNSKSLYFKEIDHEISSPDIVNVGPYLRAILCLIFSAITVFPDPDKPVIQKRILLLLLNFFTIIFFN